MSVWMVLAGAMLFASSAWFGWLLGGAISKRQTSDVHPAVLILLAVITGAILGGKEHTPWHLLALTVVVVALTATVRCDLRCSSSPSWLQIVPLGVIVVYALVAHAFWVPVSVLLVSLPFVAITVLTRGAGMSWIDVRTVALGTSLVGLFPAIVAFATAGLASGILQRLRRRAGPMHITPYLAGATALAIVAFGA